MGSDKTHYQVLGVDRGASHEEVRTAYQGLARRMHPDRNGGTAEANSAFAEVTSAYAVLSDPKRRKQYDANLDLLTEPCGKCKGKGRVGRQKGFGKKEFSTCDACQGSGRVSRH